MEKKKKKIIEVIGEPNSGKSQSIIMAAHKLSCEKKATLVAKYFIGRQVDIVEVYQYQTPIDNKYVAYAGKGDGHGEMQENKAALDLFKKVANKNGTIIVDGMFDGRKKVSENQMMIYKNMESVLYGIEKDFDYDVIVVACHDSQKDYATDLYSKLFDSTSDKPVVVPTSRCVEKDTANSNLVHAIANKIKWKADEIHESVMQVLNDKKE